MPKMSGARAFAEMMRDYGVSHIFFVPAVMMKAMAEMEDMPIKRIVAHGEKAAAYMADGFARASGRPGVCMAQNIGGSNLAAGLRDGYMAGSPIIAISGGTLPVSRYKYTYQEIEDFSQFAPVTKFSAQVESVTRLPDLLRQAFREATSGAPGPVHLQVQNRGGQISEQEADLDTMVEQQYSRVPAFRPEPDMESVRAALTVIAKAQRPVIVAGTGVIRSSAQPEVVELAEKLQMPVITSLKAKGTILDTHPLSVGVSGSYSRDCANSTLREADLVFFIGSKAGGHVTHFWHFPSAGTPVIQIDISPSELGRNYPNVVSILGDAKVSLRRMIDVAQPKSRDAARVWVARVHEIVARWRAENEPHRNSDAVPIRPERICKELSDFLPPDGVVVTDTGHSGIWTGTMMDFKYPTQRYFPCAGSLGWGFPAALGVKCALPDTPVLCFTGDGGFYYHIAELETARRWNINLVVLVNNNSGLTQEVTLNRTNYGGNPRGNWRELWSFTENNFAKIAEAFGCGGIRVEKPGDIKDALKQAFSMNKPVVVDVVSDADVLAKRVTT